MPPPSLHAPPPRFRESSLRKLPERISGMFDRIAPTYDLLNHVLSANVDRAWRARAVGMLALRGTERVLDICTGTGDLAVSLLEHGAGSVVGIDFAPEMIRRAREKAGERIRFEVGDASRLDWPEHSFDVVTVAFGVRNFEDLGRGLREMARVLVPGGRLLVLEFTRPRNPLVRVVYETYSMLVLPLVGNLVSGGSGNAYLYLPRSVQAFPPVEALSLAIRDAGFSSVDATRLTGGIAAIHLARK